MLRSFSYVEYGALRSVAHDENEFERLSPLAKAWESEARAAFLAAYQTETPESSTAASRGLRRIFEIERALFELRRELDSRPSWARIPLQAILEWITAN